MLVGLFCPCEISGAGRLTAQRPGFAGAEERMLIPLDTVIPRAACKASVITFCGFSARGICFSSLVQTADPPVRFELLVSNCLNAAD
jgi:hypothetical protein